MPHKIKYLLARLSPAKNELVVIEFKRGDIEAGSIAPALEILAVLAESRENAEAFEGRITFVFSGYDEDPRETSEIPVSLLGEPAGFAPFHAREPGKSSPAQNGRMAYACFIQK